MIEVEIKTEILKNTEVLNLEIYTLFCKLEIGRASCRERVS